ncbi:hypothetical protein [Bradyrhizobium sp. Leo121]|uniref:hypothetical protein n=1 Tax=Bradyrhizobium sp. Leo121 TaxID=1571195 RepID=UPI001FE12ECF|nr:hypothetical protein [Bradyrhizobium sp. Leo121]
MAASRSAESGSIYQTPVPAAAVAPDVPQKPLSARTTRAPCSAALTAAQVPAADHQHIRIELNGSGRCGRKFGARLSIGHGSFLCPQLPAARAAFHQRRLRERMLLAISDILEDLD